MKKLLGLLCVVICGGSVSVSAQSEEWVSPIISLSYDQQQGTFDFLAFGMGVGVDEHFLLTNQHVIWNDDDDTPADLVLYCHRENVQQDFVCDQPLSVLSISADYDAALLQPVVSGSLSFVPIEVSSVIRSEMFLRSQAYTLSPYLRDSLGERVFLQSIRKWTREGGFLQLPRTITLAEHTGKLEQRITFPSRKGLYYRSDIPVTEGASGGIVLDQYGKGVGIITRKESDGDAVLLDYKQLIPWITKHHNLKTDLPDTIWAAYHALTQQVFTQQLRVSNRNTGSVISYPERRVAHPAHFRDTHRAYSRLSGVRRGYDPKLTSEYNAYEKYHLNDYTLRTFDE